MTKNSHNQTATQLMWALLCIVVFCCIGASVTGGHVSQFERSVFVAINGLPAFLMPLMTIAQYAGLLFAPALAAIVLAAYKKYLAAVLVLLIIPAKLKIEHVVKSEFLRERPKVYIDDAILRGDVQASGLSFASGHAMIIFAIATFMTPFVPKVVRIVVWTIAVLCIIARVFLGAHLPLDVLGGALLGVALGLLLLVLHRCIGLIMHKKK